MPAPALANFLNAELQRRAWTKKDFARALEPYEISQSAAYLILRGDDNVRRDTFEAIAAALGMTPAELSIAVYQPRELSADQVAASAALEHMPAEKRPVALEMLWGLAVPPTSRAVKSRSDAQAKQSQQARKGIDAKFDEPGEAGPNSMLRACSPSPYAALKSALAGYVRSIAPPVPA